MLLSECHSRGKLWIREDRWSFIELKQEEITVYLLCRRADWIYFLEDSFIYWKFNSFSQGKFLIFGCYLFCIFYTHKSHLSEVPGKGPMLRVLWIRCTWLFIPAFFFLKQSCAPSDFSLTRAGFSFFVNLIA